MKNVFSLFGFATFLMFSFAFTPVEETVDVSTEICEVAETVTVSTAALFNSGRMYGCAVSSSPANVIYRLNHATAGTIQLDADCMPDFLVLASGEWNLFAVSDVVAHVYFEWEFCGIPDTDDIFLDVPGTPELVTQILI